MKSFKFPSRNRKKPIDESVIECPYCGYTYEDESEEDYYMYKHTKINYCRNQICSGEFINGVTKSIRFLHEGERRNNK